jgi:triacylglycerol lipase
VKLFLRLLGLCGMVLMTEAAPARETVVILHGLGRTNLSMLRLACALERDGYHVVNVSYPSRSQSLETLATQWLPARIPVSGRVHFVTHSMGGIVLRVWLRECGVPANMGRVVMLAPPNSGSEIASRLASFAPYRWATGINGIRLGTEASAAPRSLGEWPATAGELGVIAGESSLNPLLAAILPRPNDGKVSVAATHLAGERDHVVLPYSHTWLGWRGATIARVRIFLREGHFSRT